MNSLIGKSTGIALLMAAALLAALFAMGVFSPTSVGAAVSNDSDSKPVVMLSNNLGEAEDVTLTATFQIDADDSNGVVFTVGGSNFDFPTLDSDTATAGEQNFTAAQLLALDTVSIKQSGSDIADTTLTGLAASGTTVILTVPSGTTVKGETDIVITIKGITNPVGGKYVVAVNDENTAVNADVMVALAPTLSSYKAMATGTTLEVDFRAPIDVDGNNPVIDVIVPDGFSGVMPGNNNPNATSGYIGAATGCGSATDPHANCGTKVETIAGDGTVTVLPGGENSFTLRRATTGNGGVLRINDNAIEANQHVRVTIAGLTNPNTAGAKTVKVEQGTGDSKVTLSGTLNISDQYFIGDRSLSGDQMPGSMTNLEIDISPNSDSAITVTIADGITVPNYSETANDGKLQVTPSTVMVAQSGNVFTLTGVDKSAGNITFTAQGLTLPDQAGRVDVFKVSQDNRSTGYYPWYLEGATLSSPDPAAAVRIEITSDADNTIPAGEDIVVTLKDFGVPATISEDSVLITGHGSREYAGPPADVVVGAGGKVTLSLASRYSNGDTAHPIYPGTYTVTLKQSAGITNPAAAGPKVITVKDKDPVSTVAPKEPPEYTVTINRKITVSKPTSVTRGTVVTATLKGYNNGSATVKLGEKVLGSATVADNVGTLAIDTTAKAFVAGDNLITADDPLTGEVAGVTATINIKPAVAVDPAETTVSKKVKVKLADWPAHATAAHPFTKVTLGGVDYTDDVTFPPISAMDTEVNGTKIPAGSGSFEITVKPDANRGTQTLKVTGTDTTDDGVVNPPTATASLKIGVEALNITPAAVVPAQQITITGSGFGKGVAVDTIEIGAVTFTRATTATPGDNEFSRDTTTTTTGKIAITINVPPTVGDGEKTVSVTDAENKVGEGKITVAEPAVTVEPTESAPGTTVTVTGSGFDSGGRYEISYAGNVEEVGKADTLGNLSVKLTVPSDAGIDSENKVEVVSRRNADIKASADHKTPGSAITVSQEVQPGGMLTISGTNFAIYSTVKSAMIGDEDVTPSPKPLMDKYGAVEFQVLVPRLDPGSHSITVKDGKDNSATETFTVVEATVSSAPADVFADIDGLVRVFKYDSATQSWLLYSPDIDPASIPEGQALTSVMSGDVLWINVSAATTFQGQTLNAGWNLVSIQ